MSYENFVKQQCFYIPEEIAKDQAHTVESPRGKLLIAGCCSGSYLSSRVVERYQELSKKVGSDIEVMHLENIETRFSDSETCVRLDVHVGGYDVYLFQALFDPVSGRSIDQNYMALLIAARNFHEHGANKVTAVLPYLAYARQDKPTKFMREPVTAKLMADLSICTGINKLITWDPHCDQIRGFYTGITVNPLESLTMFIEELRDFEGRDDVIAVAPDAGASKFVTHFGRALDLKCAVSSKFRPKPEEAIITEIIGDFAGKDKAIILDDMISSGGTVYELSKKLVRENGIKELYIGVSHNLCVGQAYERLMDLYENYNLKRVIVTNSIPQTKEFVELPFVTVRCLSDTLARTINRIHFNQSVSEVFYRPHECAD